MLRCLRIPTIGVSGDIQKAFNAIKIRDEDQKYLKFLWFEESNPKKLLATFVQTMLNFGIQTHLI
jgi:hypothetical protein